MKTNAMWKERVRDYAIRKNSVLFVISFHIRGRNFRGPPRYNLRRLNNFVDAVEEDPRRLDRDFFWLLEVGVLPVTQPRVGGEQPTCFLTSGSASRTSDLPSTRSSPRSSSRSLRKWTPPSLLGNAPPIAPLSASFSLNGQISKVMSLGRLGNDSVRCNAQNMPQCILFFSFFVYSHLELWNFLEKKIIIKNDW